MIRRLPCCLATHLLCLATLLSFTSLALAQPVTSTSTAPGSNTPLGADGLIPNSDNLHPPYLSVYRWDVSGLKNGEHDNFAQWLNRADVWPEAHQPKDTWDSIEGPIWQLKPWSLWMAQHPRARFVYSVSILPGRWNLTGPERGTRANVPVSLAEGAKGTYNEHFRKLAENLVKCHLETAILRLGWEFNGGWMPWRVENKAQAEHFAGYWRQIVTTMRAVPGAEKLEFCWNPNYGWLAFPCEAAWPGDEYVDYVGLDIYDECYLPNIYPWPDNADEKEIESRRKKAWDQHLNASFGLKWFAKFAANHHKPLCIPEWGVNIKPDKRGGLDNPYFVEQMYRFIHDPANNVNWHCYFDVQAGDGHHQLSPGVSNAPTEFPKSAERFKKLFGIPVAATQKNQ